MEPLTFVFEPQKPQAPSRFLGFYIESVSATLVLKQVKRSNKPQIPTQRHPSFLIKEAWKCHGSEELFPAGIISEFG